MSEMEEQEHSPHGIAVAETIPLRGQLKMLANHMAKSHKEYATFTNLGEVDATEFATYRKDLTARMEREYDVRVSFTHVLLKVLGHCLKQHPIINSTLDEERILILDEINIGFAVAMESKMLIVPVMRGVDQKSILEIAEEANGLTERARENRLTLDDVTRGTFTLTNAGMFRRKSATRTGGWSTPIITMPQSAILALSRLYQKPVVRDGEIVVRTMLPTSFTIDHRVINGVPAIQFMNTFYDYIENPDTIDLGV